MDRIYGGADTSAHGGDAEAHMHLRGGAMDQQTDGRSGIGGFRADARDRLDEARARAGALADHARDRVQESIERVNDSLNGPTGVVPAIRTRPLLAVGIAFSTGLLISAVTGNRKRNWVLERGRRQLRSLIISSVTAALAHELRSIVGAEEGFGDLVQSFLGEEETDDAEFDFEFDR